MIPAGGKIINDFSQPFPLPFSLFQPFTGFPPKIINIQQQQQPAPNWGLYPLFSLIFPNKALPFGSLLFLKNWWLKPGPPGSAARVVTTVVTTEGSAGFRKVPLYFLKDFPLGRFRRVPRGSAKVPQGSAGFRKVPQWFS